MVKVIGVRFRNAGKVYYFAPGKLDISQGDHVIVETARGVEYGYVVLGTKEVEESKIVQPLKPVMRIASPEDDDRAQKNRAREKDAFKICLEKIRKHGLEMKLIDAEYTFDNNKVLFYFTADGRIDFRELVKDLAAVFKTRIELRQIGVRDETKILGGIGICGRPLCCHSYLSDFVPVSIKMAKEQNLSLNPTKISGVCGRLMCCLKNEEETYEELNSRLPNVGDRVITVDDFRGEVQSLSVLRQQVKVIVTLDNDEKEIREYKVEDLRFKPRRKKDKGIVTDEELKFLEELDRRDKADIAEKAEKAERGEKSGRSDRTERNDRAGRSDRGDRAGRPDKSDRAGRNDRGDKSGRPEKNDRGGKPERNNQSDRAAGRPERFDRQNRQERPDRRERREGKPRVEKN